MIQAREQVHAATDNYRKALRDAVDRIDPAAAPPGIPAGRSKPSQIGQPASDKACVPERLAFVQSFSCEIDLAAILVSPAPWRPKARPAP